MPINPFLTYSGARLDPIYWAEQLRELPFRLKASTVYPRGTTVGELAATLGTMAPYVDAAVDGSGIAKGFVRYDVATDASGNIYFSDVVPTGNTSPDAVPWLACPIIIGGAYLKTTELVGLDANGLADMQGKIIYGTIANGVIYIP